MKYFVISNIFNNFKTYFQDIFLINYKIIMSD